MSNRTYSAVPSDSKGGPAFQYIFDPSLVQSGGGRPITGNHRLFTTADISSTVINTSGLSVSVGNINVTGIVPVTIAGGSITVVNPVVPVSGVISAPNGIIGIDTGNRSVFIANPILAVSGNFGAGGGGFPTALLTGNSLVGITGGTLNVAITGGVVTASSSSISLTGFSPTLPPLPVSGAFSASISDTGNRAVNLVTFSPTLAPLPVSGAFSANVVDTGNRSVFVTNSVLAVSGAFSASVSDTGNRSVVVVNPVYSVSLTGAPSVTVANPVYSINVTGTTVVAITGNTPVSVVGTPTVTVSNSLIAVSGIVNATSVDTGVRAVNVTNTVTTTATIANPVFSTAITGAPTITITGVTPVSILSTVPQIIVNSGGWTAITGTANFSVTGGLIRTIDSGNRAVNIVSSLGLGITGFDSRIAPLAVSGVFAATTDNSTVVLAQASGNALALIANQLLSGVSGALTTNLAGSAPISGDIRNIPGTVLAVSGYVTTIITGASVSATVPNPLGVSGVATDVNPLYTGVSKPIWSLLPVGGRAVNPSGAGSLTGYATGQYAMMSFDAGNGGLFVNQGVLDRNADQVTTYPAATGIASANTVSGLAGIGYGTPLPANPNRLGWGIVNMSTGVMYVKMGLGATSGTAHIVLKGGTTPGDGLGAMWTDMPAIWKGPVSVTGYFVGSSVYSCWDL